MHLAALPSNRPNTSDWRRAHAQEHGQVGLRVKLQLEDLERLQLVLQPRDGGIEDAHINLGEYFWIRLQQSRGEDPQMPPPPMATVPLADVEEELRRHLETALAAMTTPTDSMSKLSLKDQEQQPQEASEPNTPEDEEEYAQPQGPSKYQKELSYTHLRGTTILLKHQNQDGERLHDLSIAECSDSHFYLLQPFEHATIAACTNCTIVVGAVAGLLHVVDCERCHVTSAARRVLVGNSTDVQSFVFTPSPPLLVGDNRTCQFAPYNTYYDGLREDLVSTGLAAAVEQSPRDETTPVALQCASNKWKQPVEIAKLEMPPVPPTPTATAATPLGADDRMQTNSETLPAPVLVQAADFEVLFVPLDSRDNTEEPEGQYCRLLGELLSSCPFVLPADYERQVLVKADRMKRIQQAVKQLPEELQSKFQEELNRGFLDWLVSSGNLRQVLDLVHLERRSGN